MRQLSIGLILTLALGMGACTAIKAEAELLSAQRALQEAEEAGAPEQARYTYTMARRYYEKAREEAGYSEFRVADELAAKAHELAVEARDEAKDPPEPSDLFDPPHRREEEGQEEEPGDTLTEGEEGPR